MHCGSNGNELLTIDVPAPNLTSVAFGGAGHGGINVKMRAWIDSWNCLVLPRRNLLLLVLVWM
ncbi:hypothetical protein B0G38_000486 [Arthrobacter sp. VKM Ac-2550]|nr:hypothetical protein [Arthrobacter sp. VKM Ac-2550]